MRKGAGRVHARPGHHDYRKAGDGMADEKELDITPGTWCGRTTAHGPHGGCAGTGDPDDPPTFTDYKVGGGGPSVRT